MWACEEHPLVLGLNWGKCLYMEQVWHKRHIKRLARFIWCVTRVSKTVMRPWLWAEISAEVYGKVLRVTPAWVTPGSSASYSSMSYSGVSYSSMNYSGVSYSSVCYSSLSYSSVCYSSMCYSSASTQVNMATFSFASRYTFYEWLVPSKRDIAV